jgi:hypothetical protein
MHRGPSYERMAAKSARVSGPVHLPLNSKLRRSALYGLVELKKLVIVLLVVLGPTSYFRLIKRTNIEILVTKIPDRSFKVKAFFCCCMAAT